MISERNDAYAFGEFRLEMTERRLLNNGQLVPLAPKAFDLLTLLVQNSPHLLEKEFLLKTLWPDSFVEDANLSVNISALRKALGEERGQNRWIETIPKRGYRFVADVTRVPPPAPTVVLAEAPEPAPSPAKRVVPRTLLWTIAAAVAVLFGAWIAWRSVPPRTQSIAVLPFLPFTRDDVQSAVGMGMSDALITRLGAIHRFEIQPYSSVVRFTDQTRDPVQIGKSLGVTVVVDGRVQASDKRIRVTVELLGVKDGKQIWSGVFDDHFSNIFAVQDQISERVTATLSSPMSDSERQVIARRRTENTEAYRNFLEGQYLATRRLHGATVRAIQAFERAIQLDSEYVPAYAALANSCLIRAGEGFADPGLADRAKTAALRALSLDENSADAHVALGQILMRLEWDWTGAERAFRKAVALDDRSAAAHAALSTLHTALGRHDAAIEEMGRACRLDPNSAVWEADRSWALLFARKFPESVDSARHAAALDPWSYTAHRQLAKALSYQKLFAESIVEAGKAVEINSGRHRRVMAEMAAAQARAGRMDEARKLLKAALEGDWDDPIPHYEVAVVHAALGDRTQALDSLKAAIDRRISRSIWMRSDPDLEPLGNEPNFMSLLRRMRLGS